MRWNAAMVVPLAALTAIGGCSTFDPDRRIARRHEAQRQRTPSEVLGRPAEPGENFAFAAFKEDPGGRFGLHLAISRDGYTWTEVNPGAPLLVPEVQGQWGMRDPSVARGPDGAFHMVWTWAGGEAARRSIGYARSDNLLSWTDPRSIQVMPDDLPVDYCWAPELFYDDQSDRWIIAWSSGVEGRFASTAKAAETNHRLYFTTTTDFRDLAPARLFFDPGYPVIDPAIVGPIRTPAEYAPTDRQQRYVLFFKDERQWPEKKQIRTASGPSPEGPWSDVSDAITRNWVEGPAPIRLGDEWVVYFDEYTRGRYGAVRSANLQRWDDISRFVDVPKGFRHGTILRIPRDVAAGLARRQREAPNPGR